MPIDGFAVVCAVKRIVKESGFKLYSEDGHCVLKTGLTVDEPEGIMFRTWRDGHARSIGSSRSKHCRQAWKRPSRLFVMR